jgi:hypothetical protein
MVHLFLHRVFNLVWSALCPFHADAFFLLFVLFYRRPPCVLIISLGVSTTNCKCVDAAALCEKVATSSSRCPSEDLETIEARFIDVSPPPYFQLAKIQHPERHFHKVIFNCIKTQIEP